MWVYFSLGAGSTYNGTAGSWYSSGYYSVTGATSVVGTSGATFYITGVQIERGSTATAFDWRPFTTELQLCQRYYETSYDVGTAVGSASWAGSTTVPPSSSSRHVGPSFKVTKRASPTVTIYSTSGISGRIYINGSYSAASIPDCGQNGFRMSVTGGVGMADDAACHFTAVAEL